MEIRAQIPEAFGDLFKPARYKVYYGGRGGAKSWNFARALLIQGLAKPIQVLCVREIQSSIKESVYNLLKQQITALGLDSQYECLTAEIRGKNGTRFVFEGIRHNADRIKSLEGTDVCWVEEADRVSNESWEILIPTIRKPGSEIWISFNPKLEFDATFQRFVKNPPAGTLLRKVSWRDNPWFTAELRFEMDRLKADDYERYLHVWEGELLTIAEGAVYGKQLLQARKDKRITGIPVESSVLVHTFWDLGRNDHTAIWCMQQVGLQHRFIDYYENRLQDLEHYVRWLKGRNYLFGTHFLPHDVEAAYLGMPKTRKQQLEDMGIKPIEVVPRVPNLMEGIEACRRVFAACWFDEERCKDGLNALANYAWGINEDTNTFSQNPIHNWASNGADAFRQFAQGFKTKTERKPLKRPDTRYVT